jgi:hypothetical protein
MAYLPTGATEDEAREEFLVIDRDRLAVEREQLRLARRGALIDGIKLAFTIAVPVAAFLGIKRYFENKEGKP